MAAHAAADVSRARRALRLNGIYVILNEGERTLALARDALDAGVGIVQYRAKGASNRERLTALRALTRERGALLILNDDWHGARSFECDGVHLGPGDDGYAHPHALRERVPDLLVGLSCGTAAEVSRATAAGVDYLGIGSVFATASKTDAGPPIGIEGLRLLAAATPLPVAAIGGITPATLPSVACSGVAMAAVISAIASAEDPRSAACELVALWRANA